MHNRGTASEAEACQEDEAEERVALLSDRPNPDASDDLAVHGLHHAVHEAVTRPQEAGNPRPVSREVDVGGLEPLHGRVRTRRVIRGARPGGAIELCGARGAGQEPSIDDGRRDQVPDDGAKFEQDPTTYPCRVPGGVRPALDILVPLQIVMDHLPAHTEIRHARPVRHSGIAPTVTRHCGTVTLSTCSSEAFRWNVKRTRGKTPAADPV